MTTQRSDSTNTCRFPFRRWTFVNLGESYLNICLSSPAHFTTTPAMCALSNIIGKWCSFFLAPSFSILVSNNRQNVPDHSLSCGLDCVCSIVIVYWQRKIKFFHFLLSLWMSLDSSSCCSFLRDKLQIYWDQISNVFYSLTVIRRNERKSTSFAKTLNCNCFRATFLAFILLIVY